jgi:hypothetical protein
MKNFNVRGPKLKQHQLMGPKVNFDLMNSI